VIEVGSTPPKPGAVYEVRARSARDAARTFALWAGEEPDRRRDRAAWLDWDEALERVRPAGTSPGARGDGLTPAEAPAKEERDG
jgi:hypothetical protein